jgi:hypothetical protein
VRRPRGRASGRARVLWQADLARPPHQGRMSPWHGGIILRPGALRHKGAHRVRVGHAGVPSPGVPHS